MFRRLVGKIKAEKQSDTRQVVKRREPKRRYSCAKFGGKSEKYFFGVSKEFLQKNKNKNKKFSEKGGTGAKHRKAGGWGCTLPE